MVKFTYMARLGRPPKFETSEQMKLVIEAYFNDCDSHVEEVSEWLPARTAKGKIKLDKNGLSYLVEVTHKVMTERRTYNMGGLALALGMSRQALIDYKNKDDFLDTIRAARLMIENSKAESLAGAKNVAGVIFDLRVNHDWREHPDDNPPPTNPLIFINNVPITPDDPNANED